jgi:hypothetical protein
MPRQRHVRCTFNGCVLFNSDVSQWNVSEAASKGMFHDCPLFDRELVSGWPLTTALRQRLFLYDIVEYATEDEDEEDEDEQVAEDEDENN